MTHPHKHNHSTNRLGRFVRDFWMELTAVLVILLALLLTQIRREDVSGFGTGMVENLRQFFFRLSASLQQYLTTRFTLLDFVGFALGALALVFILWRVRVRLTRSTRLRSDSCPVCGSGLFRVRRTPVDRLVTALFYPAGRRYRCADHKCGWTGLLHRGHHNRSRDSIATPE